MEPKDPTGPPELPESGKAAKPAEASPRLQLVNSTKSTIPVSTPDDDEPEEPDELNEHVEEPGDPDGVHAAEEEQKWQEQHTGPEPVAVAPKKRKRRWPKVLIALLIFLVAAAGAYWFGNHKASAPTTGQPKPKQTASKTSAADANPTKHYDSVNYTLGFDYPQDWVVSDTATKLTVTSPAVKLTGTDGVAADAHVLVTIQNQQTTIPNYPAAGAAAELSSDKLTYKKPTAVQRAQTYLSYLGYHKTNGLDQLFVTGDNGYQQGQTVPMSDIVKGNPLVSVSFQTCSTPDCANGTVALITLQANAWKTTTASQQVTALLQSLQLN